MKHVQDKLGTFSFYSLLLCETVRHLCFVQFSLFCDPESLHYAPSSLQPLCDGSADEAWKRGLLLSQLRASALAQLFRNLK